MLELCRRDEIASELRDIAEIVAEMNRRGAEVSYPLTHVLIHLLTHLRSFVVDHVDVVGGQREGLMRHLPGSSRRIPGLNSPRFISEDSAGIEFAEVGRVDWPRNLPRDPPGLNSPRNSPRDRAWTYGSRVIGSQPSSWRHHARPPPPAVRPRPPRAPRPPPTAASPPSHPPPTPPRAGAAVPCAAPDAEATVGGSSSCGELRAG